ncbi:prepilin-type N-terminal cleavage/methylation domain-containing protein [Prosthecobacter fusiformis]|nr:prepilin-type N-terminal cleavage/methylation domain-containing protein [Prosthecobacter fusiformis]
MKNLTQQPSQRTGYTLIEVLAAGAVIAVASAAAVSLSSSLMLQEELAWRTAITRNYQENMARLWQLGMSPAGSSDATSISAVMPNQKDSVRLEEAIYGTPVIKEGEAASVDGLGLMQQAAIIATVNASGNPGAEVEGAPLTLHVYRPALPASLRTTEKK